LCACPAAGKLPPRFSMSTPRQLSRREFLAAATCALAGAGLGAAPALDTGPEPIIDIHQHTNYAGRTNDELIAHQRAMGVTLTVLLPAGRFFGLDAQCGGNESVRELARRHPRSFVWFANEVADHPDALKVIRKHLRQGARGIGEQKFRVACDSPYLEALARLAEEFAVPILLHFQHDRYNTGIENFHRMLEKFPKVNFIGHAQTWWANVDKNHDQPVLYPKTKVTAGGITDRLLSDHPNMFGDLSAGSGLNFQRRDEEHARWFLAKHQDRLLLGTDCDDRLGSGPKCDGAQIIAGVRRLAPDARAARKILYENARRLLKL
jgi:predicted TIM-barrel fold metal-dependent hydrolase